MFDYESYELMVCWTGRVSRFPRPLKCWDKYDKINLTNYDKTFVTKYVSIKIVCGDSCGDDDDED